MPRPSGCSPARNGITSAGGREIRENLPLILAVGPTPLLVKRALAENGIVTDGGRMIRMVTRYHALRGWGRVMPVVAIDIDGWGDTAGYEGHMLRETLLAMIAKGQMRIAQPADLERFRREMV